MTATLRKLFSAVLSAALAAALLPAAAFADSEHQTRYSATEASFVEAPSTESGAEDPQEEAQPLALTIDYQQPVTLGVPTIFTMQGTGGAGEYTYRPYSLYIYNGESWQEVVDFSFTAYSPENTFEFTFDTLGTYRLRLSVFDRIPGTDPVQYQYTSTTVQFDVTGPEGITAAERNRKAAEKIEAVWGACLAAGCNTEYERALWLHDWVIDHCEYDNSLRYYQAADLLLDGRGTCEAYHAAYMALLNRAGIACGRVSSSGHVWTSVRIDGQWCHVDTTHDDSDTDWFKLGAAARHRLFGLDDSSMAAYLAVNGESIKVRQPSFASGSLQNSFLIRSGEVYRYSEGFVEAIQENLGKGSTSFSLPLPANNWPENYCVAVYRPVAYQLSSLNWSAAGKSVSVTASYNAGKLSFAVDSGTTAAAKKASLSKAKVTGLVSKAYTGKRITQKPTVKLAGKTLKLNRDYTLHFANNTKRGTATVTVKGMGSYTGSKKASFKIVKYKQPMKCSLKAKAKTVRASKISKSPVSIPKPFTVKKAKGKLTFANVSTQKTSKTFKVNSRTGTVTIPKMTKKGTYLLKVRIQAAGSSPYAYGSRNLTLKVQIR